MKLVKSVAALEKALRDRLNDGKVPTNQVARETGIPNSRLIDFKRAKREFSIHRLNVLANYFGVKFRIENWKSV